MSETATRTYCTAEQKAAAPEAPPGRSRPGLAALRRTAHRREHLLPLAEGTLRERPPGVRQDRPPRTGRRGRQAATDRDARGQAGGNRKREGGQKHERRYRTVAGFQTEA